MSKRDIFPNPKTADIVKVSNIAIVILQSLLVFIKIYWSLQQLSESHVSAIYIFKLTIDWSIEEEMDRVEHPQQSVVSLDGSVFILKCDKMRMDDETI